MKKLSKQEVKQAQTRALKYYERVIARLMKKRTLSKNEQSQLEDSQRQASWLKKELGIK